MRRKVVLLLLTQTFAIKLSYRESISIIFEFYNFELNFLSDIPLLPKSVAKSCY